MAYAGMTCPNPDCKKPLHWVGDEDNGFDACWGFYRCEECDIDVFAYIDRYGEDEE